MRPKSFIDDLPNDIQQKLQHYLSLLEKWQQKINLVSPQTMLNAWERHFIDSAQISALIPKDTKVIYDLGCGAGFPGLVLAMMNADIHFYMIESDQKKCSFMKAVSRETNLSNVTIINERIEVVSRETVYGNIQKPDIIMARALASLAQLLTYSKEWIAENPEIQLIFPKGARFDEELALAQKLWDFQYIETQSITDNSAAILTLSNVRSL